ncbi:MAG: hypothetical protein HY042_02635, partial [Spirochaetia bacterium]|nr:hypothetical protein [Spirochaetia bacterium]
GNELQAQQYMYVPPGYGSGQNVEGAGWGFDTGYKKVGNDYYVRIRPQLEMPIFGLMLGIQIPLDLLAIKGDKDSDKKVGSIRDGMYNDKSDYMQLINYARHGTHLYYNPGDINWSFYVGKMSDGYIGHHTIIDRYVTTYDPTVYRAGVMGDINNDWGGVEFFKSDVLRSEVIGTRAYIRPFGVVGGLHDLVTGTVPTSSQVATSMVEMRDPRMNGGVFFEEPVPEKAGGRMDQYTHEKMKDVQGREGMSAKNRKVEFREVTDPVTGKTQVRAFDVPDESGGGTDASGKGTNQSSDKSIGPDGKPTGQNKPGQGGQDGAGGQGQSDSKDKSSSPSNPKDKKWGPFFLNRWSIGYTLVKDYHAPLTLETDGSGVLVVDPDTLRPRAGKEDVLTVSGVDTEIRLAPVDWIELTPYVDLNRMQVATEPHLDSSKGLHAGIDMGFRLSKLVKFKLRPEYREISSNYIPTYFDSAYAVERTIFQPPGTASGSADSTNSTTKLTYLKSLEADGPKKKGYYVQGMVDILNIFVVDTSYEDYAGVNNSKVFTGVYVPNIFGFFLDGYYTKKNFDQSKEAYIFDDRSLAAAEAGYTFFGLFRAKVTYQRTWVYSSATSKYIPQDEKQVGFSFASSF